MKTKSKWAMNGAAAGALALLLATPMFAQSRGNWNRNDTNRSTQNGQWNRGQSNAQHGQWNRNDSNRGAQNDQRNTQQYDQRNNQQYGQRNNQQYGQRNNQWNNDSNRNTQFQRRDNNNGGYRENQRINASGRVTSFSRERDGYRVQLDRGRESYWIPQATFGNRALRSGLSISLGGVFRGGSVYVDAVNWPDSGYGGGYYGNGYVRGVVDRVDYRSGTIWLQDDATGREIAAQTSGRSLGGLRPGDYVELSGQWIRGTFAVARIDNVRGGGY
jgi:hypothetical protein